MSERRKPPPFDPGQIVYFKPNSDEWAATPPNSDGPKRVHTVRWVNAACQSGYLIDVRDADGSRGRWNGYDSDYFEVRQ